MRTRSQARISVPEPPVRQPSVESSNLEKPDNPPIVTMADNRTMAQLLEAPTEGYEDAIVIPEITANNFEIKHGLLNLVQNKQFFGNDKEDPHAHIRYFNKITSTMKIPNVPNTSVKLMLFPFSLEGAARIWLEKEPPRSIETWDDLILLPVSGTIPCNTVTVNPKEDLKDVTSQVTKKIGDPGLYSDSSEFTGITTCNALVRSWCVALIFMPYSVWNNLSLPELTPTCMTLELADRSITKPIGIAEDVFVNVGKFQFPADFVVVRLPFRSCFGKERPSHSIWTQNFKYTADYNHMTVNKIDVIDMACDEYSQEVLGFSNVIASGNPTPYFEPIVSTASPKTHSPFGHDPEKELKLCEAKSSVDEPPEVELKELHHRELPSEYCIFRRKLNEATRKDHFPLPFMDQMLERLAGNEYYCFLDGFSGYFQIPIDQKDQEKTTFTCPYRTFCPIVACLFGYAIAPGHIVKRCEDTNLSLNWEKSHFMVKEGIVLGHKISKSGLEVDRAKVEVIAKLPHPTTVKGCRSKTHAVDLLLQEFDIEIRDKKGAENLAVDHMSRLENPHQDKLENKEINESFPLETLGSVALQYQNVLISDKNVVSSGHAALDILKACRQ
ncbi:hypothetical protein Tco_0974608 [Tanacetum coccineum]|uniref:Reverse transcriptase domain-containing protein n=1 Tax=Tanacetum coccineum TaxID=301880 RepID=A0ABQ5EC22_9ASTR